MASEDTDTLSIIQDTYVPFMKKLIVFLEKTKKTTPDMLNKIKSIYTVFTTADEAKQVEVFQANKKKLEKWYKNAQNQKERNEDDRSSKRPFIEDTDSSQGASDIAPAKRQKVSASSEITITSTMNASGNTMPIPVPIDQIKKEKPDKPTIAKPISQVQPVIAQNSAPVTPSTTVSETTDSENTAISDQITFTCASCQFQTLDDQEFMKHTRTDHRSDLSMWCKQCGKCFSNAGVLVSHIKERACTKEEMIYRCGVKDCTFETTSGQTFVHHLRHCHKGSPFIFCVHCQKIFTLPHCLILHMQDDCPFKEKNRRNPGSVSLPTTPSIAPTTTPNTTSVSIPVVKTTPASFTPKTPTISSVRPVLQVTPVVSQVTRGKSIMPSSRGRGRGRARGRGRPLSDSSDSDDPDDPSWRPEEVPGNVQLRRSGRWAKKINDVINVEPKQAKKSLSLDELNSKEMLNCSCCDFMAAFKSVLEDHYIAHHKVPNKNACLVCHLKFENTQGFIEHFKDHDSGKLTNIQVMENTSEDTPEVASSDHDIVEQQVDSNKNKPVLSNNDSIDNIVKNISEVSVLDPTKSAAVKIPYQAAIHDKNLKDAKLKKFEELKSPNDLITMRNDEKIKHFFKCALYNCSFTTDNNEEFSLHTDSTHKGKRLHCCYCLKECFSARSLTEHIINEHISRNYQCSSCFYRAYSRIHVQIHIKNYHAKDTTTVVYFCESVIPATDVKSVEEEETLNTTWPYVCAIGDCKFQSFDPKEFKDHSEVSHRLVTVFYCHYCKVDFISFKRLLNHYRLHGINTFQCNYCIHGSETKDEILLHLCTIHADRPLRAYMRGSEEDVSSEAMLVPFSIRCEANTYNKSIADDDNVPNSLQDTAASTDTEEAVKTAYDFESVLYDTLGDTYYPKYLHNVCSDLICGIPHCSEKLENMSAYIGHLRNAHAVANFSCPHCPQMSENWDSFKNHLQCHGPNLYACSFSSCGFYDWDKSKVERHLKSHTATDIQANLVVVREKQSELKEDNDIVSLPQACPFNIENNYFQCFFCYYKSSNRTKMKNHLYQEMMYKRVDCNYCNESFTSKREIKDHTIKMHPDSEIDCKFSSNVEIDKMMKKLLQQNISLPGSDSYSCDNCSKTFKFAVQYQKHVALCFLCYYQPYDCGYCDYSCSDIKILKFHLDEKHYTKSLLFHIVSSSTIEGEVNTKIQSVRLKQLQEYIAKDHDNEIDKDKPCHVKFYVCSICSYESNHKYNLEIHFEKVHSDAKVDYIKSIRNLTIPILSNSEIDDNSNDCSKTASQDIKRYRCGFCIKKMFALQELIEHVESLHPVRDEFQYSYYYSPDFKFTDNDQKYECSYCKYGKETLSALKTHCALMHPESPFKVRGFVIRNSAASSIMACGYCYIRIESNSELKRHFSKFHPNLPQKSIADFKGKCRKKYSREGADELPNKRVRFGAMVFVCSHCGAAFSSKEQVAAHSKKSHSRLPLEFTNITPSDTGEYDVKFYKCEFCQFTSQKEFLKDHLAAKHKMRVTCGYCNKRFEFASKLKEHHDVAHKTMPVKYTQVTVGGASIKSEIKTESAIGGKRRNNPKNVLDLSKITLFYKSGDKLLKTTALTYSKLHNISPFVILKDMKKE